MHEYRLLWPERLISINSLGRFEIFSILSIIENYYKNIISQVNLYYSITILIFFESSQAT